MKEFFKDEYQWVIAFEIYGDGTLLEKATEHALTEEGAWWNFTSEAASF